MTSVVVTGAGGYLGSRVSSLLVQRGVDIVRVGRSAALDVRCDLLSPEATAALLSRYPRAVVVHCAANVPGSRQDYSDHAAAKDSLAMVRNLTLARPSRMVFASSMTVYPSGVGRAREEDAQPPSSGYAWGKFAAERLLLNEMPKRVTILRFPGLFGPPRRSGLLYNVAKNLAERRDPQLSTTLPQWAAVHVEDAADICVRAALRPDVGFPILNAGYPDMMSIPDAVERLAHIFGRVIPLPQSAGFAFDLTRLQSELGPVEGDYQTRLQELANWVQHEVGNHLD